MVTGWKDVVEELPPGVRVELTPLEAPGDRRSIPRWRERDWHRRRATRRLLSVDQGRHIDELIELSGQSSSEVPAALFDLELKGVVRQLPGKQFVKVLL